MTFAPDGFPMPDPEKEKIIRFQNGIQFILEMTRDIVAGAYEAAERDRVEEIFTNAREAFQNYLAIEHKAAGREVAVQLIDLCTVVLERIKQAGWNQDTEYFKGVLRRILEAKFDIAAAPEEIEFDDAGYEALKKFDIKINQAYMAIKTHLANLADGWDNLGICRSALEEKIEYLKSRLPLLIEAEQELKQHPNLHFQRLAEGMTEITIPLIETLSTVADSVLARLTDEDSIVREQSFFQEQLRLIEDQWLGFASVREAVINNPVYRQYRDVERPKREKADHELTR